MFELYVDLGGQVKISYTLLFETFCQLFEFSQSYVQTKLAALSFEWTKQNMDESRSSDPTLHDTFPLILLLHLTSLKKIPKLIK